MQKSLREDLALRGYDLVFEYKGSTIAIDTKEFTSEKEEVVYQKYGLKTLRGDDGITLYNPEVWEITGAYGLTLTEDCLAPEQPFFVVAPVLELSGSKNLSHWDVSSATDLSWIFYRCMYLKELILDGWDVSRVKDISWMFSGCRSLKNLSLNGWDVSSVEDTRWMFSYCESLESLPLDGWYLSEDTKTDCMFECCPAGINVASLKRRTTPCSIF